MPNARRRGTAGRVKKRVRIVAWNAADAQAGARKVEAVGYEADHAPVDPAALRNLKRDPPAAIVIDLSRLPSHGRDVALAVRTWKPTRHVPLIFVEGAPDKIARTKLAVPDAVYTTWSRIRRDLGRAVAHPPADPVVPPSVMAGYSGTPLPRKLGIKPGSVVALVNAPRGFEASLGTLPEGVRFRRGARGRRDLTVWFAKSSRELKARIRTLGSAVGDGSLWIAWPKQASGVATDLTQTAVRRAGLDAGLVDFKICAIDATWSGLRFCRRKIER